MSSTVLVIALVVVATTAIVLIVVAPWRRVRSEKPLPPTVETRILLGEDPHRIAADLEATERPSSPEQPPELRTAEMQALQAIGDEPPPPPQPE